MASNKFTQVKESLSFLLPHLVIKKQHLLKKDVKKIKDNLANNLSVVYLIEAIVLMVLVLSLMIYKGASTGWQEKEAYGFPAFLGELILFDSCVVCIILFAVAKLIKNDKASIILNRISIDLLFVSSALFMILCILSDAMMGFTTSALTTGDVAVEKDSISAALIFITFLLVTQSPYWIDAIVLDSLTSIMMVFIAFEGRKYYDMAAPHYYGLVAIIYPAACYVISCLLFFTEVKHYQDRLEKEKLTNTAYYDSLTKCKSRFALTEFIKENSKSWENKENANVLMVLFDIDDFKLYNDQFSHVGGDFCLKAIADAIRTAFPTPNLDFFRYGGEEFLLFFELRNPSDANIILNSMRKSIESLNIEAPKGAPKKYVTISIGGLFMQNIKTFEFEKEMKVVDDYLYKAKSSGKDVSCFNGKIL